MQANRYSSSSLTHGSGHCAMGQADCNREGPPPFGAVQGEVPSRETSLFSHANRAVKLVEQQCHVELGMR